MCFSNNYMCIFRCTFLLVFPSNHRKHNNCDCSTETCHTKKHWLFHSINAAHMARIIIVIWILEIVISNKYFYEKNDLICCCTGYKYVGQSNFSWIRASSYDWTNITSWYNIIIRHRYFIITSRRHYNIINITIINIIIIYNSCTNYIGRWHE